MDVLTLDDLIGECDTCGGSGDDPHVRNREGNRPYGERAWSDSTSYHPGDCTKCLGTGRRGLTDAGHAVTELFIIFRKFERRNMLGALLRPANRRGGD